MTDMYGFRYAVPSSKKAMTSKYHMYTIHGRSWLKSDGTKEFNDFRLSCMTDEEKEVIKNQSDKVKNQARQFMRDGHNGWYQDYCKDKAIVTHEQIY